MSAFTPDKSGESVQERLNEALVHHQNGRLEDALIAYTGVVKEVPGKAASTIYSNMGAVCMSLGDFDAAKESFSSAVNEDSTNSAARMNLAIILTSKFQEHKKALIHCIKALELDQNNPKIYHLLANIMQELDRLEDASKYFAIAEQLAQAQAQVQEVESNHKHSSRSGDSSEKEKSWVGRQWALKSQIAKMQRDDVITIKHESKDYSLVCVSSVPLIISVKNVLNVDECSYIIDAAQSKLDKSFIMGGKKEEMGSAREATYRSSSNAWLGADDKLRVIQKRIAAFLELDPVLVNTYMEELQVVMYEHQGEFKLHQDSSNFHPRFLTALFYLNDIDVTDGGATWFPFGACGDDESSKIRKMSVKEIIESPRDLSQNGLKFTPVAGDLLLFFNHDLESGSIDPAAVHAGTEFHGNKKWIANYWLELNSLLFK
jgi:hypothetical protein